jgi:hypothetical protein
MVEEETVDPRYHDPDSYGTAESFHGEGRYPPDWDARRSRVRRRDDYTCQDCGVRSGPHADDDGAVLHVHHDTPLSGGGSNRLGNLETLCAACHDARHDHDVPERRRSGQSRRSTADRTRSRSNTDPRPGSDTAEPDPPDGAVGYAARVVGASLSATLVFLVAYGLYYIGLGTVNGLLDGVAALVAALVLAAAVSSFAGVSARTDPPNLGWVAVLGVVLVLVPTDPLVLEFPISPSVFAPLGDGILPRALAVFARPLADGPTTHALAVVVVVGPVVVGATLSLGYVLSEGAAVVGADDSD